jgi:predicted signal transduction protein with EAL and GGDEF domain
VGSNPTLAALFSPSWADSAASTRHVPPSCLSLAPQHARYGAAVSDLAKEGTGQVRFVLTALPPLRSLAISSVSAVVAAAMIVFGTALELPQAVAIVGIVLMVFAVVLAVIALLLTARLRTTLILDRQSITITSGRHRRAVAWSTIQTVKMQGPRLLLITAPEAKPDAEIVNPRRSTDATFAALIAEIQRRLNADRGYRRIS